MKMPQECFDKMKRDLDAWAQDQGGWATLADRYEKGQFKNVEVCKDLQMRFCFDCFYAVPGLLSYVCTNHNELLDGHIYTALKQICPPVTKKY